MTWVWVVALLGLLVLLGAVVYYLSKRNPPSNHPASDSRNSQPHNPSVFVDMDDKPPMEIDFDAGIKASQRALSKNPSKDEAS
ncbi:hypothetical protein [Meiothermus sp. CFH 77666]|uniref:hypothetical protein n=1 Tax=Meiothermus sp. CFH 77666 TaxID=2817942 RepID=UPI001AA06DE5|nr:hypothetical protein [Meiothermus sp. CFH 77666]MBO1436288.1 hypothetical protein [Meiothermus sp. CFH 77666]